MKNLLVLLLIFFFGSCATKWEVRKPNITPGVTEITTTYIKSNWHKCWKKEIVVRRDTIQNITLSKEMIWTNCRGAYSYETARKKWEWVNGKRIKQKT